MGLADRIRVAMERLGTTDQLGAGPIRRHLGGGVQQLGNKARPTPQQRRSTGFRESPIHVHGYRLPLLQTAWGSCAVACSLPGPHGPVLCYGRPRFPCANRRANRSSVAPVTATGATFDDSRLNRSARAHLARRRNPMLPASRAADQESSLNSPYTSTRPSARDLASPRHLASADQQRGSPLRFVTFAVLHLALLAAMYGAAMLNAKAHELEAGAYGAGQVEHLGRMTLHPLPSHGGRP